MLFKPALFVTSTLALLAAASPLAVRTDGVNQCNTGSAQCCNSSGTGQDKNVKSILGLLGIVLDDVTALLGLGCSPILGGGSCNQQPFCCTGNNFAGLIVIGCSPLIVL